MKKNKEVILLVDDEAPIRKFISRVLAKQGYTLLLSTDGEEALALSEDYPGAIDLLLTDVMMPVMNGKELADRLCELRPEIKILFISAFPGNGVFPEDSCEENNVDILVKPFSSGRLLQKVREILDDPPVLGDLEKKR